MRPFQLLIPIIQDIWGKGKKILVLILSQGYRVNNSGYEYIHLKLLSRVSIFAFHSIFCQILAKELV